MATIVIALRIASLLIFAAPMLLLRLTGRGRGLLPQVRHTFAERIPVLATFAAVGCFFPLLVVFGADAEGRWAPVLTASGCLLAVSGAVLIFWSRVKLGAAWSLVPVANEDAGLVTTGPYRVIRHPIYLGFLMMTGGEALAFNSVPAFVVLAAAIAPAFLWRAYAEEHALARVFGERYSAYRQSTKLIIP
jgi:protein-S-isoprenylcysteine O-methyltransferase Ste14